ncbi:MAG: hypothetical protein JXQ96_21495 [Cyclobacteriaceae bacterium]
MLNRLEVTYQTGDVLISPWKEKEFMMYPISLNPKINLLKLKVEEANSPT